MSKFAKLFELKDNKQVLATLEYDSENDTYEMKVRTDSNYVKATMTLGFKEEEQAVKALEELNIEMAEKMREQLAYYLD